MFSSSDSAPSFFSIGVSILAATLGYLLVLYIFAYFFMQLL